MGVLSCAHCNGFGDADRPTRPWAKIASRHSFIGLMERLECRVLLAANPFSNFADSLNSEVAAVQSAVDNALQAANSLKSLPFIGQQLGGIDQVQSAIDGAGNKIQSVLSSVSNASPHPSDLQNALWAALGTNGGLGIVTSESNIIVDQNAFQTNSQGIVTAASVEIWIHEAPTRSIKV